MWVISLFLLAAGVWIYAAAAYQNYGQAWAYNTCAAFPGFCDHSSFAFYAAVGAATIVFVLDQIRPR
jgi:hypothetical protein